MKFSVYAYYLNTDGSRSGYLVESGNGPFMDIDKYTYEYCKERISWDFEWLEITVESASGEEFLIKKAYRTPQE